MQNTPQSTTGAVQSLAGAPQNVAAMMMAYWMELSRMWLAMMGPFLGGAYRPGVQGAAGPWGAAGPLGAAGLWPWAAMFGQAFSPGASPFGQPFSAGAYSPFGQPFSAGASPFGQPFSAGTSPFSPGASPFGQPFSPGTSPFSPDASPSGQAASPSGQPASPAAQPSGEERLRARVEVQADRPARVSIDLLRAAAGSRALRVTPLRFLQGEAPPIAGVDLAIEQDGAVCVRVSVPVGQPDGLYTGGIVAGDGSPAGVVAVVLGNAQSASASGTGTAA